jgi:hypothetical protein
VNPEQQARQEIDWLLGLGRAALGVVQFGLIAADVTDTGAST